MQRVQPSSVQPKPKPGALLAVAAAALFLLFMALIVLLADTSNLGVIHRIYDVPYADKLGHFVLYGVLALLVDRAALELMRREPPWQVVLKVSLVLAAAIALEELSQVWIASRTADWFDLLSGYAGVVSAALLVVGSKGA